MSFHTMIDSITAPVNWFVDDWILILNEHDLNTKVGKETDHLSLYVNEITLRIADSFADG